MEGPTIIALRDMLEAECNLALLELLKSLNPLLVVLRKTLNITL